MKKQKFIPTALILSASLGLMAYMFFGLASCSKQPATNIISGTVSFDDGWCFLKDSLSGAEKFVRKQPLEKLTSGQMLKD